jgi:hypothetical protein
MPCCFATPTQVLKRGEVSQRTPKKWSRVGAGAAVSVLLDGEFKNSTPTERNRCTSGLLHNNDKRTLRMQPATIKSYCNIKAHPEEVGHVVAEAAVVGVLLDGHDLDCSIIL